MKTQNNFLTWIYRGGLQIFGLDFPHVLRLIELSEKFSNIPIDLADATLVVASGTTGIREIASIDGDFYIYREIRNRFIRNIFI